MGAFILQTKLSVDGVKYCLLYFGLLGCIVLFVFTTQMLKYLVEISNKLMCIMGIKCHGSVL
jgi:hypothetical protein